VEPLENQRDDVTWTEVSRDWVQ